MIAPGSILGLVGGGQLGRMSAIAAKRMGYFVHVYEPTPGGPAAQVSDREFNAGFDKIGLLEEFARSVDVISFEFENIPSDTLRPLENLAPIRPDASVLHTCQNREREKAFLKSHGYPHAPFAVISSTAELTAAVQTIGTPSVLKTADFGYDGKGQSKINADTNLEDAWKKLGAPRGVLEGWVDYTCELSVVCARGLDGRTIAFPVSENIHTNHILDFSIVPSRIDPKIQEEAVKLASAIINDLGAIGLVAVEMFLDRSGKLLVNELAPRPHNSGHYTFDACTTSQFEQHVRAACGLPLGSPSLLSPVVMVNLLGDLWKNGKTPDWKIILEDPDAKLHLYGKTEARAGRKMGHYCVLADSVDDALSRAKSIKDKLSA